MEQVEQLRDGGDGRPRSSFPFLQLLWFLFVPANLQTASKFCTIHKTLYSINLEIVTHVCIQPVT